MNYIYYKNWIYKILDRNDKNYTIQKLKPNNELIIEYKYNEIMKIKDNKLHHFSSEINQKSKK